jgi:hypothetical protein
MVRADGLEDLSLRRAWAGQKESFISWRYLEDQALHERCGRAYTEVRPPTGKCGRAPI